MPTLAPTVHERLARCGTRVFVDGVVTGADVVLSVGGVETSVSAGGGAHNFTVPSLNPGDAVKARQDAGGGFSPFSPEVIVEDALVPPGAAPQMPAEVGSCSHCVRIGGMVPGCDLEVLVESNIVGQGVANKDGAICVGIDLSKTRRGTLSARMIVCGQPGPLGTAPIVAEGVLPKPLVGGPLYGCQAVVPLSSLDIGSRVRLESDGGDPLGTFCSCWTAVNVRVLRALIAGEQVRAQAFFDGGSPCKQTGPWSGWQPVVPPDENIKPKILEPLIAGDQVIRVDNQILGADLLVRIQPTGADPAEEFGPRPASQFPEIALNAPLAAGNVVSVVQTLCAVSVESDPVTVVPLPPVVHAPVIVPPLYACAAAVQVSNLHPGAFVRLFQNGIPIGVKWAGLNVSISVLAAPALIAGGQVTATQKVGSITSAESDPVDVLPTPKILERPRILRPVALGDTTVWVSRVTPGALVRIRSGTTQIGEAAASEPIVRVPVTPVMGPILPRAQLCSLLRDGLKVTPITEPNAEGAFPGAGEEFLSFGNWTVPATVDGASFETRLEGQIYFPATSGGKLHPDAQRLPLVIIAHGLWNEFFTDENGNAQEVLSFVGYDYLARHLARWGMLVFSLRMDDVNNATSSGAANVHQYARAEIILHAVDELVAHSRYGTRINPARIGLIGHSMGGEGVVVAQFLNESESRGYGIRGVVSIAPTNWRPEVILRGVKYLQLLGSLDLLVRSGVTPQFSGFRIYDRAWRRKSHAWIYKARHNPFNRRWIISGDTFEGGGGGLALPEWAHEHIARGLINAFFQDTLRGEGVYAAYMEGTILPHSIAGFAIHMQFSDDQRDVVDNFGDLDEQALLPDSPLNKGTNSRGQAITAGGSGLDTWEDVDHTALDRSPHQTKGVELAWNAPNVQYITRTGGIASSETRAVALRIGQFLPDDILNPVDEPADLFVVLRDGAARESTVRLGAVAQIPYPDTQALCPMRTVRLPLDAFLAVNPALDLANIRRVTLRLIGRATGHVLADDVEIGR